MSRYSLHSSVVAGFFLIFIGIFGGEYYSLYYLFPSLDKVLHTAGGAVLGWFAWALFRDDFLLLQPWKRVLFLVSFGAAIGVVWEWAEYAGNTAEYAFPTFYRYFHGGDLWDTLSDLAADMTGTLVFALAAVRSARAPQSHTAPVPPADSVSLPQ